MRFRCIWVVLVFAHSTYAWDRIGHMVVGIVAWEHMSSKSRELVVKHLKQIPDDAGIILNGVTSREFFLRSCNWADMVRNDVFPKRKAKYDKPTWHYVNLLWRKQTLGFEESHNGELVNRLNTLDPKGDPIDLAWTLHLIGDIHQPLHSSGRITNREPNGDRGGNDFRLAGVGVSNLHSFWDTIFSRFWKKKSKEDDYLWASRIAEAVVKKYPRDSLEPDLRDLCFSRWSMNGAILAREYAYPEYLERDKVPPYQYQHTVVEVSQRQTALAGYRLAMVLNDLF